MTTKKLAHLPIGPILDSKDLREKEVIAALIAAAEMCAQLPHVRKDLKSYRNWLEKDYDRMDDTSRANAATYTIVELEGILATCVPDYAMFTGPNGQHRSWGVYPDDGAILDGEYTGDIKRTTEQINIPMWNSLEWPIPAYNLVVNDHGNMTLYRRQKIGRGYRWREVWSVV